MVGFRVRRMQIAWDMRWGVGGLGIVGIGLEYA